MSIVTKIGKTRANSTSDCPRVLVWARRRNVRPKSRDAAVGARCGAGAMDGAS